MKFYAITKLDSGKDSCGLDPFLTMAAIIGTVVAEEDADFLDDL